MPEKGGRARASAFRMFSGDGCRRYRRTAYNRAGIGGGCAVRAACRTSHGNRRSNGAQSASGRRIECSPRPPGLHDEQGNRGNCRRRGDRRACRGGPGPERRYERPICGRRDRRSGRRFHRQPHRRRARPQRPRDGAASRPPGDGCGQNRPRIQLAQPAHRQRRRHHAEIAAVPGETRPEPGAASAGISPRRCSFPTAGRRPFPAAAAGRRTASGPSSSDLRVRAGTRSRGSGCFFRARSLPGSAIPSRTILSRTVPSRTVPSRTVSSRTVSSETVSSETVPDGAEQVAQGNIQHALLRRFCPGDQGVKPAGPLSRFMQDAQPRPDGDAEVAGDFVDAQRRRVARQDPGILVGAGDIVQGFELPPATAPAVRRNPAAAPAASRYRPAGRSRRPGTGRADSPGPGRAGESCGFRWAARGAAAPATRARPPAGLRPEQGGAPHQIHPDQQQRDERERAIQGFV